MPLSKELEAAYNRQIDLEFASSHAYLQLAAYFSERSLTGFEAWMRGQASEEREHALKFFDFVLDRDGEVKLGRIDAPPDLPTSVLEAFEISLDHERKVTAAIRDLFSLAEEEGDSSSYPLLQWFLQEQIEEEATVGDIVDQLSFADGNPAAILMLDREYASRPSSDA